MSQPLKILRPGRTEYRRCYALQKRLVEELVADRRSPGAVILTEHDPVLTLGRSSKREHILADRGQLSDRGVAVVDTDRGGDVTFHGPGQIVLYPVLPLERFGGRDLGRFLRAMEEVVIRALRRWGLDGRRIEGLSGVWVDGAKVCAMGLGFRRWISFHGIALNLDTDMSCFDLIVPCGIRDRKPTSMAKLLGEKLPPRQEVEAALLEEFATVFGVSRWLEAEAGELPPAIEPLAARKRRAGNRRRHPPWMVKRLPAGGESRSAEVGELLDDLRVGTVCRSANCPNLGECFACGTAAFLIMGPSCTRRCTFCSVPKESTAPLDPGEPDRLAEAARRLELDHVVVTSVTRDDLPDGGASHFAAVVRALRTALPGAGIELLVPDFRGDRRALQKVMSARPTVLNHNVETVPRLYARVRPGADYRRSLELLSAAKRMARGTVTKSGLMVGLGERPREVSGVLRDLASAGVGAITVGQYLAPTDRHHPVAEYVRPEQFEAYAREAGALGIAAASCGPWVRSSYGAAHTLAAAREHEVEDTCSST